MGCCREEEEEGGERGEPGRDGDTGRGCSGREIPEEGPLVGRRGLRGADGEREGEVEK